MADLHEENRSLRAAILLLHRIANLVASAPELEPTCYALLTGVTAGVGLGLNRAMLFVRDDEDRGLLRGFAAVGPADLTEADQVWRSIEAEDPDLRALYEAGLQQRTSPGELDRLVRQTTVPIDGDSPIALAMRRAELVRDGSDDLGGLLHLPPCVAAPLRSHSTLHGVLVADNRYTGRTFTHELVFGLLADHAGTALGAAHRFEHVAAQARTDALTGLGHHGALMDHLDRAVATDAPLGLAMIDLDDFKAVNDTLGHAEGDRVLVAVARFLERNTRAVDVCCRIGGDEFAVILPDTDEDGRRAVVDRLRHAVRPAIDGRTERIGLSVGVATCPPEIPDADRVVAAADEAMYRDKERRKALRQSA